MADTGPPPRQKPPDDPVYHNSRREAAVALAVWLAAMIYSIVTCWLLGYGRDHESLTFVLGFPDWVFWGVLVPWGVCILFSTWFCLWFMTDETLGEDVEEEPHA